MVALALAIATTGCATRSATVGHRMLLPETSDRHALAPTQFFVMPVALSAPEPVFPATADVGAPVDVVVCAEIWLSADGDITRVAPFDATPDCAPGADPEARDYAQAVADVLRGWEFTPAMICEFPPQSLGKRARGDCRGPEVVVRRVPVRLNYAFTFSSREGKRRVGIARKPSHDDVSDASGTR